MSRTIVLGVALAFVAVLAFLTLYVLIWTGPDVLVVLSLVILALFAVGVIGALATPPDDR
jgi:hypothetical protein